jgi:hypothetical protein
MTIPEMPDLSLPPSGVATGESEHKGPGERSTSDFPRGSAPASAPSSFALKPWQAGFSSWSRIPLLLEMYCHLRRVTQALIKQESLRQAVVATVWLTMCKIFAEESRTPRSNLTAAQKRILLAKEVEKKVAVLIKARGAEIHQDWKIRLQERIAGNFNLLFLNNLLRFTTLVTRPSSGQSSHSKKTMPPAVIALTYTFLSRRRSDSSRRHTLSLAPTSSYAHYRCPSIEASKIFEVTKSSKSNTE